MSSLGCGLDVCVLICVVFVFAIALFMCGCPRSVSAVPATAKKRSLSSDQAPPVPFYSISDDSASAMSSDTAEMVGFAPC